MANFRVGKNVTGLAPVPWNKDTTTTAISAGEFLYASSGEAVAFDSAGCNLAFIGVASSDSAAGEARVHVYEAKGLGCDLELVYDLDTLTSVVQGTNLAWSASLVVTASDTDAIFRCSANNSGGSAAEVHCKMKESLLFRGDAS